MQFELLATAPHLFAKALLSLSCITSLKQRSLQLSVAIHQFNTLNGDNVLSCFEQLENDDWLENCRVQQ